MNTITKLTNKDLSLENCLNDIKAENEILTQINYIISGLNDVVFRRKTKLEKITVQT
jgi:hypothetical protein